VDLDELRVAKGYDAVKLTDLRKAASEGDFATKRVQCFGCYSAIEVPLTTNAIGLCKRCPEKAGWVRVNSAAKCQMPCPDPIDYMKDVDGERIGYCRKHTIELHHASIDVPSNDGSTCICQDRPKLKRGEEPADCAVCFKSIGYESGIPY